eukprot:2764843-Pleurochrysis_carterae.AAC.1
MMHLGLLKFLGSFHDYVIAPARSLEARTARYRAATRGATMVAVHRTSVSHIIVCTFDRPPDLPICELWFPSRNVS